MPMPSGRSRSRIPKKAVVELALPDTSQLRERAVTENVSARGVRVATQRAWPVGSHVVLISTELGIHSEARVVYCQLIEREKFAVGLELLSPEKDWAKTR
jgi:PilZ domain